MKKVLFVLCLLNGLMFINAGLNKFFNYMPVPKNMPEKAVKAGMALMQLGWLMPLVGTFEIIGGLLFIIPRTRALGSLMLVPIFAGIIPAVINMNPSGLPIVLVMLVILIWAIINDLRKFLPIISK